MRCTSPMKLNAWSLKFRPSMLWNPTIHTWSTTFCTANHFFWQSSFFVEAWVSKTEIAIGWRFDFAIWPTVWLLSRNCLFWFFWWWCIRSWFFVGRSSRCTCKKQKVLNFNYVFIKTSSFVTKSLHLPIMISISERLVKDSLLMWMCTLGKV